jgi:hypothetical protein
MDKFFSNLDFAVSQISHSFFRGRFYRKSGAGLRENSACCAHTPSLDFNPSPRPFRICIEGGLYRL